MKLRTKIIPGMSLVLMLFSIAIAVALAAMQSAKSGFEEETPLWRSLRERLLDFIKIRNAAVENIKTRLAAHSRQMLLAAPGAASSLQEQACRLQVVSVFRLDAGHDQGLQPQRPASPKRPGAALRQPPKARPSIAAPRKPAAASGELAMTGGNWETS